MLTGRNGIVTPSITMVLPIWALLTKSLASSRTLAAGMVEIDSCHSGVYVFTASLMSWRAGVATTPLTVYVPSMATSIGVGVSNVTGWFAFASHSSGFLLAGSRTYSPSGPMRYGPLVRFLTNHMSSFL